MLFKFFPDGAHVVYRFDIEEAGRYTGWLRYGSKGEIALRVAVDPADEAEPQFETATLPETGGYIGEGVWGWAPIFEAQFTQGAHSVAIGNAAIRLDCLWITSGDLEPSDERLILTDWREILGEETWRRAQQPLEAVHPDWLDEIEDTSLTGMRNAGSASHAAGLRYGQAGVQQRRGGVRADGLRCSWYIGPALRAVASAVGPSPGPRACSRRRSFVAHRRTEDHRPPPAHGG